MHDAQMPDWIKQRSTQQQEQAVMRVRGTEGEQFWGCVFRELMRNVGYLPEIGASGSVNNLSTIADPEQRYRLNVRRGGRLPSVTYTDLFYKPETGAITCRTLEEDVSSLHLCLLPEGGIGVIPEDEYVRLDAKDFAGRIVKDAVERLASVVSQ